jgi:hypothetical protein
VVLLPALFLLDLAEERILLLVGGGMLVAFEHEVKSVETVGRPGDLE